MSIEPWMAYLWGQADVISGFATAVSFASCFGLVFLTFGTSGEYPLMARTDAMRAASMRWIQRCWVAMLVSLPLAVFTPSSKTIAMMYVLPAISKSEAIQKDAPELFKMAVDALKEKLTK